MTVRWLAVLVLLAGRAAGAQTPPPAFGSGDDLFEFDGDALRDTGTRPDAGLQVGLFGGAAYLPDRWRGALRAEVAAGRGLVRAGLGATIHPTIGGLYGPEADEAYDLLRAVEYIRLDRSARQPLYLRLGPTEHVTLGAGALARDYRTTTAWDERTLGAEAAIEAGLVSVAAFTDDVRLSGVVGGEVSLRTDAHVGPLGGLRLTLGGLRDLGPPGDSALTGLEATLRATLGQADAPFGVVPFVTVARYLGQGTGVGAGIEGDAFRASPTLRATGRAAVFVSTSRFLPGAVNPFYAISNADERIVSGRSAVSMPVGTPLDSLSGGVDVVVDVRFVAFGRFEFGQHIRRHIGPDRASAYGLRVAARLPARARAELSVERQGFRGLFGFLGSLGDENALVLDVTAPVGMGGQLFVRSRYGYRRLPGDGPGRFLAERRFEPLLGVRVALR